MSLKSKYTPTEAELEILQLLWEFGPSTVRFINEKQNSDKDLSAEQAGKVGVGYTTTLKIMQIMAAKGMLVVNKDSRQHIYTPTVDEDKTKGQLLDGFLKKTFSGSASKMVLQALGNHNPSKEELNEIKKLIEEIENQSFNGQNKSEKS
jgi:predicted transcriptional regulator